MIARAGSMLVATLLGLGAPGLAPAPAAAVRVCRMDDERLTEVSGLAVTSTGYVVVDDGSDEADHRRVFFLDRRCAVVRALAYPSRPRDTEDLALAADGTLWVGDIGDNNENRETIGLWQLPPGGKKPKLYRLTYPDGAHNAETLLLTRTGVPIVVTKTIGSAALYEPAGALDAGRSTPLRQAGTVTLPTTGTSNPFGLAGQLVVTGGAVSPDGRHVVLRTYADAFEFDVTGDDLVRAVTEGEPRTIPLPDEPQGEAITYTADGTALLTASEVTGGKPAALLRYPLPHRPPVSPAGPAASASPTPAGTATTAAHGTATTAAAGTARFSGWALATGGVLIVGLAALLIGRRRLSGK